MKKLLCLFLFVWDWGRQGERRIFPSSFFQVSRVISRLEYFFISAGIFNKTFPGFAPKLQLCWFIPIKDWLKKHPMLKGKYFFLLP